VTNAVSNAWYLREMRNALGLSPYNRGYLRLLPSVVASVSIVLLLRLTLDFVGSQWVMIVISAVLSYIALVGTAAAMGSDDDDRLIARAAWSRIRQSLGK